MPTRSSFDRAPSKAIGRERAELLKDLGIGRGDTRNMPGRIKFLMDNEDKGYDIQVRSRSNKNAPGQLHHGDVFVVAQAKAIGAEILTLDVEFRKKVAHIPELRRRYGQARIAPESFRIPVTPTPPASDTREILRRLLKTRAAVRSISISGGSAMSRSRPTIPRGRLGWYLSRLRGFIAGVAGRSSATRGRFPRARGYLRGVGEGVAGIGMGLATDWIRAMNNERLLRSQSERLDEELDQFLSADHTLLRMRAVLMLLEGKRPYILVVRKVFQVGVFDDMLHRRMWEIPSVTEERQLTDREIEPFTTTKEEWDLFVQSVWSRSFVTLPMASIPLDSSRPTTPTSRSSGGT